MIVTIEKSGYYMLEIDDETKRDEWGNDWTEFTEKVAAGKSSDWEICMYLDPIISDMDDEVDIRISDNNGVLIQEAVVF